MPYGILSNEDHVEDVHSPALDELAARFSLHELAIEDCRSEQQRAKVEDFDRYLFIIANNVHFEPEKDGELSASVHKWKKQCGFRGSCDGFRFLPTSAGKGPVSD